MNADIFCRFDAARNIVQEASELALRMRPAPGGPDGTLKGAQDWVTEADGAVERLIAQRLAALFPDDPFEGEETGLTSAPGRLRWVVDPIDGTSNYARGRNRWCISLGLMEGDEVVAGIIAAPAMNETYTAVKGHGAFLNGKPIRASDVTDTGTAMIEMGWSRYVPTPVYVEKMEAIRSLGAMPRSCGSGSLALAEVACGRQDGYIEMVINLWDVAAGLILLDEAGAVTTPFLKQGGLTKPTTIMTAAPGIAQALSEAAGIPLEA